MNLSKYVLKMSNVSSDTKKTAMTLDGCNYNNRMVQLSSFD